MYHVDRGYVPPTFGGTKMNIKLISRSSSKSANIAYLGPVHMVATEKIFQQVCKRDLAIL